MSTKVKFSLISLIGYLIFATAAFTFGFLDPNRIGLQWSIFWYIAAALITYYLWFKNVVYKRVMYYARQLKLTKNDLQKFLPNLKKSQDIPDPQRKNYFAPIFNFPLQGLDVLDKELAKEAKEKGIKPFK
ncbi:hypothetical protein [Lentilactobacillus hilgardii]|uniref:hypothetical protein n=1 Tax=Lentilactobacillus hilgardii TaxID=1588 RepID=UPI003FA57BB7